MRNKIHLFLNQFLVIYYQCNFINVLALFGENVLPVTEHEFPFIVAVIKTIPNITAYDNYKCTGSLVSRSDVVTAEHCVRDHRLSGLQVIVGSSYLNLSTPYNPEWWIAYDNWAVWKNVEIEYFQNDIAIINLLERVPDTIQPVQIIPFSLRDLAGCNVFTAGWGLLRNNTAPMVLHKAYLRIVKRRECEKKVRRILGQPVHVDHKTICTNADPYILLNRGDSGGPLLFADNFLVGVNHGTIPITADEYDSRQLNSHMLVHYYRRFIFDLNYQCNFINVFAMMGANVEPAQENEFPFVVGIIKFFPGDDRAIPEKLMCTGSLVSRSDVVTSEHCTRDQRLCGLEIIVGSSFLDRGTTYYPEWWISYDNWAFYRNITLQYNLNDVALINLLERVPDTIQPSQILAFELHNLVGINVVTAGWGLLRNDSSPMVLYKGPVTVISKRDCGQKISLLVGRKIVMDDRTICTFTDPYLLLRDGDSGGPLLVANNVLVGINFGTAPATLNEFDHRKVNIHMLALYYNMFINDLKDLY